MIFPFWKVSFHSSSFHFSYLHVVGRVSLTSSGANKDDQRLGNQVGLFDGRKKARCEVEEEYSGAALGLKLGINM